MLESAIWFYLTYDDDQISSKYDLIIGIKTEANFEASWSQDKTNTVKQWIKLIQLTIKLLLKQMHISPYVTIRMQTCQRDETIFENI